MTRVLVLDPHASLTSAVVRCLRASGLDAVGHTGLEPAADSAGDAGFDVALVDGSLSTQVPRLRAARVVLMIAYPDPRAHRELARQYPLLAKPFTTFELLSLLRHELPSIELPSTSLVAALQTAHSSASSLCLVVEDVVEPAEIYVIGGELHDARRGGMRGEPALRALLEQPGRVRATPGIDICRRTIFRPFHRVLLDALADIEDAERGGGSDEGAR